MLHANIEVVIQESLEVELKLALVDNEGVFLEIPPIVKTVEQTGIDLTKALSPTVQHNDILKEFVILCRLLEEENKQTTLLKEKLTGKRAPCQCS